MKRLAVIALVLLLLFCLTTAYAAAPGSSGDPLVSLNYINGTFKSATLQDGETAVNTAIGTTYSAASKELQEAYNGYLLRIGGIEGYAFAGAYTPISLPAGTSAKLITGSTFVLTAGTAAVQIEKGVVINISTGTEVVSASALTQNQRYFCAEDTVAQFAATSASTCLIDGYYQTGGTIIVNPVLFSDVRTTDWFYNAVKFAGENNLFKGTTPTTFAPQMTMSRAMFVTVLHRLAGQPASAATSAFSDVSASQYYAGAVNWASACNVVSGYNGQFQPDMLVTREQMAAILYRYAAYAGYSTYYSNTAVFDSFSDKGSVSAYSVDAMKWATYNGVISGANGKLMPGNTASRAEVAQIIMNFSQKLAGL